MDYLTGNLEKYNYYLNKALAVLFKNKEENGFWDDAGGRIIKRLIQNEDMTWMPDESFDLRYGPFGLMGVLYHRHKFQNAYNDYDEKIKRYLDYLVDNVDGSRIKNKDEYAGINYGILTCFSIGYLLFKETKYLKKAIEIFNFNKNAFKDIKRNILSLIIWGESWLYEALIESKENRILKEVKKEIRKRSERIINCQNEKGYFETGDFRAINFARTMYTLWGLGRAIKILGMREWLGNIERALEYNLENQKTSDGAFLWHPKFYFTRLSILPFKFPIYYPKGAEWLFECHQTFFINAVEQYKQSGGTKDYFQEEINAIEWIFSKNRINKNLVELSGIGVPIRIMSLDCKTYIKNQNFKGTYEVGSYIMALSDLITRLKNNNN